MSHVLTTARLVLRPFREEDTAAVFDCCRNPELGVNAGWKPHETIGETREAMQAVFLDKEGIWAVTDRVTGGLVGAIGIMPDSKRENPRAGMIGYWLRRERWGAGLMGEAADAVLESCFGGMGLDAVSAYCYPDNARSIGLLERRGFVREGTLRRAELSFDGRLLDHVCLLLTHEAYAERIFRGM